MKRFLLWMNIILSSFLPFLSLSAQTVYPVSTAADLFTLAAQSQTDNFAGKTIRLMADIDLGGAAAVPAKWTPIGNASFPFAGELDGNNHVIRNLYIMGTYGSAGLMAETAPTAVVHNLALAQGLIMTDGTDDIGALVGINRGTIHHCFSMLQIIAHNGNRIGGLVGTNYGIIQYAYNTGIITDANNNVGGLVGLNKSGATVSQCYNTGYCKGSGNVGALFGTNEAGATLINVRFDQQNTRMHATGLGDNDTTLNNNDHAVTETSDFLTYFTSDSEWDLSFGGYYPQLACFAACTTSILSTYGIQLSTALPIERADGVGAPKTDNSPRKSFALCSVSGTNVTWASENTGLISVGNAAATVSRPCTSQEVILTVALGLDTKQIYTQVKGYDAFNAGKLDGNASVCWEQKNVKLRSLNKGDEPSGGLDNEQKAPTDYQYWIIRYWVTLAPDSTEVYTPMDSTYLGYKDYQSWAMPTDIPGHYAFERRVHDYQCHTDWLQSDGLFHLIVREPFDPGKLYQKVDTIYGLPADTTIFSEQDATGGSGKVTYLWHMTQVKVNYLTGERDTVKRNETVRQGYDEVKTASCPFHFTEAGEYTFERASKESACTGSYVPTDNMHTIIVFDQLNPGSIVADSMVLCTPLLTDTIFEQDSVSGGNGLYTFRWICNGVVISGTDTTIFCLDSFPMTYDHTYVFRRQVRDETGLTDWTTSAGEVIVRVHDACYAACLEGDSGHVTRYVTLCEVDMPYTGIYTFADGSTQNYLFAAEGDSAVFNDVNGNGCPLEVTLRCRVTRVPIVELQPVVSVCQSQTSFRLEYAMQEGYADRYDLNFSQNALAAGFEPQTDARVPIGYAPIEIVLNDAPAGSYLLYIRFYSATAGTSDCKGFWDTIPFSVNLDGFVHRKWDDVVFVDNSDKNCEPDCEHDLRFTAWQWYKDDIPLPDATGQYYYEQGGLNGSYHVVMRADDGTIYRSCDYDFRPHILPKRSVKDIMPDDVVETTVYTLSGMPCLGMPLPGMYIVRYKMKDDRIITLKHFVP